jgi:hypothetical protein
MVRLRSLKVADIMVFVGLEKASLIPFKVGRKAEIVKSMFSSQI